MQLFYIVQKFQWTATVFFNFRYSSRKSESQQKLANKIIHFTIQFRSESLTHFMNLNSLDNATKNFSDFKNFSADMFLFGVRKKICTAPFLDALELHS